MDNWFKSKWFVRAVSLAFAILLFTFVNVEINDKNAENRFFGTSQATQAVDNVPVDIRIDKDHVVSGVPEHVRVSLEGPQSIVAPVAKQRNFEVFVDLRGLGEGEHQVEIQYANISDDVKVYIEPKTIDVVIEERSSKEFNVNVDFINEDKLPDGYEIGDVDVNPQTVTIRSSKSVVDQIAIVKVFVDVGGLTESIKSRELPVNVYDSQGNELNVGIDPENVEISAAINNPSKKVPVSVETTGKLPEGYDLASISSDVEEVSIYGTSSQLADVDQVTTEKVDLSKITESGTMDVNLALPDGVKSSNKDTIKVKVELDQTKTIKNVPINVENLGDDQEVTFVKPDKPKMNVTAAGKAKDIGKLTSDDIQLSVDLTDLDDGEHKVPVTIDGPDGSDLTGDFDEVTVDITAT
ncbi:CdaR family protein [Lentibacillus sp. N15]|uniref:CdaR family protein n=1 Tax=Lentibacillus songyuanensis TaxID=3136161 RepID=UPI0031BAF2B2